MYLGQSDEQGFYATLATKPSMCVARKYPDPNHGVNFNNCHPNPPKWSQPFLCYAEADKAAKSIQVYDYQKFQKLFLGEIW